MRRHSRRHSVRNTPFHCLRSFNTSPGIFVPNPAPFPDGTIPIRPNFISQDGVFCDPQLGCSDRLVAQDLVTEHSWQFNQEFRLASKFAGPPNFSIGGNYLHYETYENYYVFINTFSVFVIASNGDGSFHRPYIPGVTDNHECMVNGLQYGNPNIGQSIQACQYVDPNPITNLNNQGHNYFLSQNPYVLNSYAAFGEVYYDVTKDVKLTGGLRWTEDQKHFS